MVGFTVCSRGDGDVASKTTTYNREIGSLGKTSMKDSPTPLQGTLSGITNESLCSYTQRCRRKDSRFSSKNQKRPRTASGRLPISDPRPCLERHQRPLNAEKLLMSEIDSYPATPRRPNAHTLMLNFKKTVFDCLSANNTSHNHSYTSSSGFSQNLFLNNPAINDC